MIVPKRGWPKYKLSRELPWVIARSLCALYHMILGLEALNFKISLFRKKVKIKGTHTQEMRL